MNSLVWILTAFVLCAQANYDEQLEELQSLKNEVSSLLADMRQIAGKVNFVNQHLNGGHDVGVTNMISFQSQSPGWQSYQGRDIINLELVHASATEIGGAFDDATSTFTCPDDGVYAFTASIQVQGSAEAALLQGTDDTARIGLAANATSMYGSATNTGIILCATGDELNLVRVPGAGGADEMIFGYLLGYKIAENLPAA